MIKINGMFLKQMRVSPRRIKPNIWTKFVFICYISHLYLDMHKQNVNSFYENVALILKLR